MTNKLLEQVRKKYKSIYCGRVPDKTYQQFMKLSEEDFCEDNGMTLKFLIDLYNGLIPDANALVLEELKEQRNEIERLKEETKKPKEEEVKESSKRLGGSIKNDK